VRVCTVRAGLRVAERAHAGSAIVGAAGGVGLLVGGHSAAEPCAEPCANSNLCTGSTKHATGTAKKPTGQSTGTAKHATGTAKHPTQTAKHSASSTSHSTQTANEPAGASDASTGETSRESGGYPAPKAARNSAAYSTSLTPSYTASATDSSRAIR